MENITENFLSENCSPEVHEILLEALNIITNVDEEITSEIDVLIFGKINNVPHFELLTEVRTKIELVLFNIITRFGITLSSDVDIRFMINLFNNLLQIEETDQSEFIRTIIDSEEDNREAFIRIVSEVIGLDNSGLSPSEDDYYAKIYGVARGLIFKIYNNSTPSLESFGDKGEDIAPIVNRVRIIAAMFEDNNLAAIKLIKADCKLGMTFSAYMNIVKEEVFSTSDEDIAKNVYLIAAMSSDGAQDIPTFLLKELATYNSDLESNTAIVNKAREYSSMEASHG